MKSARSTLRKKFLQSAGWGEADVDALRPDASFRRYFRLRRGTARAMLMDAPPPQEGIAPFVRIARFLSSHGVQAPEIYKTDIDRGFLLLEDLGDNTFTRLLAAGADEERLYKMAVDILLRLHSLPTAQSPEIQRYDNRALLDEALLFIDWYLPALRGNAVDPKLRQSYVDSWLKILTALPPAPPVLVLRDYHVDNLMLVGDLQQAKCAVLDFQDALLGPAAYDLVSLLQDARRDISRPLEKKMLDCYFQALQLADRERFMEWYKVLGVQRHCKVAGIFVRLCLRDEKCAYLEHIPRVIQLLQQGLERQELAPLKNWIESNLPEFGPLPEKFDPNTIRTLLF